MAYSPETHIITYKYCGKIKLARPYCERFKLVLEANSIDYEVLRVMPETPLEEASEQKPSIQDIDVLDVVVLPSGLRGVVQDVSDCDEGVLCIEVLFKDGEQETYLAEDIEEVGLRVIGNVSTFI